jgi:hypothetical protein
MQLHAEEAVSAHGKPSSRVFIQAKNNKMRLCKYHYLETDRILKRAMKSSTDGTF